MKKIIISSLAVMSFLSVMSCNTDFENDVKNIAGTTGEADFTNFVSLGNSLTAGYRDGALYLDGQLESYPSIIAKQMQEIGGGGFSQPLVSDNNGGLLLGGVQIQDTKLYISGFTNGAPSVGRINNNVSTQNLEILSGKGTYNNMGVPGARVAHLLAPNYGNMAGVAAGTANPYFVRFASSPTTSVIADFINKKPTFFSLWIGNNDALLYALAGGDSDVAPLTPANEFGIYYNVLAEQITTTNAKGVIANIPDVTTVPALTTVPYNPLTASTLGQGNVTAGEGVIDLLNARLIAPLKQILTAIGHGDRIQLLSKTGQNPLLIKDENLTNIAPQIKAAALASGVPQLAALADYLAVTYGQARHAQKGDLIPLSTRSVIGQTANTGISLPGAYAALATQGVAYPLADRYVLTAKEVEEVSAAVTSYNETIKTIADAKGWAFVDANQKMKELAGNSGISYNGVNYSASYVTGGAFSLDGVHLTGKGYAVIANEFIKAINSKYKSNIPQVNPNNYSGVKFP